MTEEKQKLLREIAFLSGLIDNHKKQESFPPETLSSFGKYEITSKRPSHSSNPFVSFPKATAPQPGNSRHKLIRVNSEPMKKEVPNRVVIPPASMLNWKENTAVKSSSPQPQSKLKNLFDLSLSPIVSAVTPTEKMVTRTVLNVKNVNLKRQTNPPGPSDEVNSNEKASERIVLKPTRYKWTSKPKSNEEPAQISPKIVTENSIKKSSPSFNSAFKISKFSSTYKKEKMNKTIRTKYKFVRGNLNSSKKFRGLHKIINATTRRISPKFIRRVGKYSIKYVAKERKTTPKRFPKNYSPQKLVAKRKVYLNSFTKSWSPGTSKIFKIDKTGRFVNSKGKFVVIGGMLYRTSRNKLSRTNESGSKMADTSMKQSSSSTPKSSKIITVRGIKFAMDSAGKTLKRLAETSGAERTQNLSRVDIGGETFIQTQPGLLVRSQATTKRTLANRSVNRSINRLVAAKRKSSQYCLFYNRFGKCSKKDSGTCPYIHDPEKIAVCNRFLQGKCTVENCPFSHKICTTKMPSCKFFLRGRCHADTCPYLHVNVNPMAEICNDFVKGYCALGEKCKKLHSFNCPEFVRTGQCSKKEKCQLKHIVWQNKNKITKIEMVEENINAVLDDANGDEDESTSDKRLPSFIKLKDDSDLPNNDYSPTAGVALVIRPRFFS